MSVLIAHQITERLLAGTRVRGEYTNMPASDVFWALYVTYLKDTPIELDFPQLFRDPLVTIKYAGVPLRTALQDLCAYCGVRFQVTDQGGIRLSLPPAGEEKMRHRVVIDSFSKFQRVNPIILPPGINIVPKD